MSICDFCEIFCLIKDVLCDFVWVTKKYQMHIYCIDLFVSLFTIPSQNITTKNFAKPLAKVFRKPLLIQGYKSDQCTSADIFELDVNYVHIFTTSAAVSVHSLNSIYFISHEIYLWILYFLFLVSFVNYRILQNCRLFEPKSIDDGLFLDCIEFSNNKISLSLCLYSEQFYCSIVM